MMLMGVGENKLPGADEELGLIPTGAWPEVVGGSGTPNPPHLTHTKTLGVGGGQGAPTCPVSLSHTLHPLAPQLPGSQAPSTQPHCGLTAGPSP